MRLWLTIFLVFMFTNQALASAWEKFLPARHALMHVYLGDLNQDKHPDAILLARSWDEAQNPDTPRVLLVLLRDKNGYLKRVARANTVVSCAACGGVAGDPWARTGTSRAYIQITKNGFLLREFIGSGWRGWRTLRFAWRASRFWFAECTVKTWHISQMFAPAFTRVLPKAVPLEAATPKQC